MRYLRRVRLLSSVLFVGVLGILMAPFSSEANTTVTFQVDSGAIGTLVNVANGAASTCTVPAGYSRCYALQTGGTFSGTGPAGISRSFTIKNYLGAVPRLLVTDSGGMDNLTLTTVEFAPAGTSPVTWGSPAANIGTGQAAPNNYGERHTLKVVITHKFDQAANIKTNPSDPSTRYKFALRASGMFKGNLSGATGSGDFVKFEGTGQFGSGSTTTPLLSPVPSGAVCDNSNSKASPLDVNYCPLRRTLAKTALATSSFSSNPALEQVNISGNPYPNYACDNGNNGCTPTITLSLTATLNGPDSWILSSSGDAAGGSCNLVPPGPPVSTPAVPCQSQGNGKKNIAGQVAEYFDGQDASDAVAFSAEGAEATPACVGEECNCLDPDTCGTGTIKIVKFMDTNVTGTSNFEGTGEGISNFSLTANAGNAASRTFTGLFTGESGGSREINEISFPTPHIDGEESVWRLDSVVCDGDEGQVTKLYGPSEGPLVGVRVNYVNNNQTVTCSFDNHHSHDGVDSPFGHPHPPIPLP